MTVLFQYNSYNSCLRGYLRRLFVYWKYFSAKTSGGALHAALDIPHKNYKSAKSGILLSSKNDKQKALQINFSARAFDLQGFNKFLQFGYNHLIRFTLYASILEFCSRAINTCWFCYLFCNRNYNHPDE